MYRNNKNTNHIIHAVF